jgi:hypothetical protein
MYGYRYIENRYNGSLLCRLLSDLDVVSSLLE